jgi:hypothetical protein
MNNYYIYLHIKLDTGEPFYVGKGKKYRAQHSNNRSLHWNNVVNKHGYDIIFLEINLTEQEALEKETYWINRIGRKDLGNGPLVNFTNGGEGASGISDETRNKKRISMLGKNLGNKSGIGNKSRTGMKATPETIEKLKLSSKGRNLNRIHSKESKENMSISKKGKKIYNNGLINKLFIPNEQPSEFIKGKIKRTSV